MSRSRRLYAPDRQADLFMCREALLRLGGMSCLLVSTLSGCHGNLEYHKCQIYDATDYDHDNNTEKLTTYTYDEDNHLESIVVTYDYFDYYYYLVEYSQRFTYGDGRLPTHATIEQISQETSTSYDISYEYAPDNPDHLASAELDLDGDGASEATAHYSYSSDGKTATSEVDFDHDGKADEIETFQYYDYPLYPLRLLILTDDQDADGTAEINYAYTFNEAGLLETISFDSNEDGELDATQTLTYDEHDNVTRAVTNSTAWAYWIDDKFGGPCYE